jgi:hypothetical protein
VYIKEMQIITNDGKLNSVIISSNEIKYVRLDDKDNIIVRFQKPKKRGDKTIIGYRGKLVGDATGDNPGALLKTQDVYEEEMEDEEKILREGTIQEQDMI